MIDKAVKELANGKNFAALTTLFADGQPQTQLMWVDADDEHILINTELHRQKVANVQHDPRVAVAIFDAASPYHYAEVRGRVVDVVRGPQARAHVDDLSRKYTGAAYANEIESERVILKIAPDRQRSR